MHGADIQLSAPFFWGGGRHLFDATIIFAVYTIMQAFTPQESQAVRIGDDWRNLLRQ